MSVWFSRKTVGCWKTDYEPKDLLRLDVATNDDLIRLGVHDGNQWFGDVMFNQGQIRALILVLEKLIDPQAKWWQKVFKKLGVLD